MNSKASTQKPQDYFAKQNVIRRHMNLTQNSLNPFDKNLKHKKNLFHNPNEYDLLPEKENSDSNNINLNQHFDKD